jgi:NADH-quinone oxidoreductase subunit E
VDETKPDLFTEAPADGGDDLKVIKGVGPKLEGVLHDLGVYYYRQIAAWTPSEVAWVDERLKFKGRIERDGWIAQAKELSAGSGGE